uniref:Protein kinase domain-containing protein n=1 Tax=Nelumbo nucifera TaxID=4432 RepID=A0A822ZKI1_NELNU|nr:TPA_asm: hypothetical protein HUJ06_002175 [Nelumbo nucifera]
MERKLEKGKMEQSKSYEQLRSISMETKNEELGPSGQRPMQDPSSLINTNVRPPEFVMSGTKPVLNYSIQTGSESGSDISMIAPADKGGAKEFERKGSSMHENKGYYESVHSVPRTSSKNGSNRGLVHGYASSGASDGGPAKLKFLCSFGGKILPRPSDGKLRYVGGETRIIRISKDISWQELMQKALTIYGQAHTIKYQLPGEDLDALVSVSCDEDLQNMMEECNVLGDGEGSQKLRMFLFSAIDLDDPHFTLGSIDGDSEVQYVVAVNGMELGPRRNSSGHDLASSLANNLDELLSLDLEKVCTRVAAEPAMERTTPLTGILVPPSTKSSQLMPTNLPSAYETHVQSYQGQIMHHEESEQYLFSAIPPPQSFHNMDRRNAIPSSGPSHHGFHAHPTNYVPFGESSIPIPHPGNLIQQGGLTVGKPYNVLQGHDSEVLIKDTKQKLDGSIQKNSESEQIRSLENAYFTSSQPHDGSVLHSIPTEEVPVATTAPERGGGPMLSSKSDKKLQEPVQGSVPADTVSIGQTHKSNDDDPYHASGGVSTVGYTDSEADPSDFSYPELPVLPHRGFQSERIPRELGESQNRLSKSDDSYGSQFLLSHSRSDMAQQNPITESAEKLHEGNLVTQTEQSVSSAQPLYVNPTTIGDGLMEFAKYKELADVINQMNPKFSEEGKESTFQKSELNKGVLSPVDDKDTVNEDASHRGLKVKGNHKEHTVDEAEAGSEHPSASQETSSKHQEDSASNLPEVQWGDVTAKNTNVDSTKAHMDPFGWTENSARAVSREEPSVSVATKEQGDILIDINDRFPRDFLSDIFLKARESEDISGISPLNKDGTGLSLNMENHEPQHWSFFQKLAQDEFVRKNVSLMDQDHLGYSSPLTKVEEAATGAYNFPPLKRDGVALGHDSQINFEEEVQLESSGAGGTDTITSHPNYNHPQVKDSEGIQFDGLSYSKAVENVMTPDSEYEDVKFEIGNIGLPLLDSPLGDFDISTLQIIKNEDLEELRELGSGTFGTVYHGKWRGTDVAIKRIKKSCFTGRSSEQERLTVEFWREAEILSKLHHPNVVAFYGVVQDGPGGTLATVTEYMVNGSLRHVLLRKDRYLDRRKRLTIAMDAAFGMEYLHSKNIVHFDLKCDNLLVNLKDPARPICKVGDFGLSKIKRNTLVSGGVRGTLPWMAPELLNGSSSKVSEKVDVFSFGIVLWEILTGEEPYANMHYGAIIGGIVNNTLRPPVPNYCDLEWRRLMEQCWAPDPLARPSFTEIASRLRVMSAASQTKPQGYSQTQAPK